MDIVSAVRHMVMHSPEIKLAIEAELFMPACDASEEQLRSLLSPEAIEAIIEYGQRMARRKTVDFKREKRWRRGGRP